MQYEQETSVQGKDPKQVRDKLEKKARLYEKIKWVQPSFASRERRAGADFVSHSHPKEGQVGWLNRSAD